MTRSYRLIWTALMIIAVVLAGTTSVFSYLAAVSADSPGCAGRDILPGYGRDDFFVLPLFALFALAPFVMGRRDDRIAKVVADYDMPVIPSLHLTFGMLVIYLSLGGFVAFIGFTAEQSVERYEVISSYCGSAVAPS
jgi:hypothetical protein